MSKTTNQSLNSQLLFEATLATFIGLGVGYLVWDDFKKIINSFKGNNDSDDTKPEGPAETPSGPQAEKPAGPQEPEGAPEGIEKAPAEPEKPPEASSKKLAKWVFARSLNPSDLENTLNKLKLTIQPINCFVITNFNDPEYDLDGGQIKVENGVLELKVQDNTFTVEVKHILFYDSKNGTFVKFTIDKKKFYISFESESSINFFRYIKSLPSTAKVAGSRRKNCKSLKKRRRQHRTK